MIILEKSLGGINRNTEKMLKQPVIILKMEIIAVNGNLLQKAKQKNCRAVL